MYGIKMCTKMITCKNWVVQKNAYLQNGAEHIALVATAPPPIVVTAAPKHLLSKVCEILT